MLTIKDAKFDRSRLVPLPASTTAALRCYAATDDRLQPAKTSTFFVSATGTVLTYNRVHETFVAFTTATGLRSATPRPRIHDLRHCFAVHTLLNWYRSGADVQTYMPVLSTYLGHVSPASTYWYLSAVPELMQIAAGRLRDHFGGFAMSALAPT